MGLHGLPVRCGARVARTGRPLCAVLAALAVATGVTSPAPALAAPAKPPAPDARNWILVDAADGTELAAHSPNEQVAIASTTKLMTAYLALRRLKLDDELTAPPYQPIPGESLLGLRPGERITVRDLLYGLLMVSGNDAAVALADGVAGSTASFVEEMNRAAVRLGLDDTHYANPIGLDDPGNYSTAHDLARLTVELRTRPSFRRIVDTQEITLRDGARTRRLESLNLLLRRVPWVNGVKTGHTFAADYCLVGSGTRKGVTLVSVVLGASSEAARDDGTLALLRYGLSQYHDRTALRKGERLASAELRYQDETLPLVAGRGIDLVARRDQEIETSVVRAPSEVEGPVKRGEALGAALVTLDGEREARVPLVAAHAAAAASLIDRIDSGLPGQRTAAWGLIASALVLLVVVAIGIVLTAMRWRASEG